MTSPLEAVSDQLAKARSFADIFGPVTGGDTKTRKQLLKKQYAILAKLTHPDRAAHADVEQANTVFAELSAMHRRALEALEAGRYEKPFNAHPHTGTADTATVTIVSGSVTYQLEAEPFAEGDFSNLHRGMTTDGRPVFAKIATDPTMNPYLVGEASLLSRAKTEPAMTGVLPFLPNLLDSVILTEAGNEQYRVNLFDWSPGLVSLADIKAAYPNGVRPEDAAWIWRRVLGQTLAANMLGVVHGAIVPDHVLVHPTTHEPLHIGWAHAVERPQERHARVTTIIDRWRDWYPPEVLAREIPSHQTDLYMAGKTMVYLLGGDVARDRFPSHTPKAIEKLVRRCLSTDVGRRPRDGLALMREFTGEITQLWGREYRPLAMPVM
jgi:hypothetical protein